MIGQQSNENNKLIPACDVPKYEAPIHTPDVNRCIAELNKCIQQSAHDHKLDSFLCFVNAKNLNRIHVDYIVTELRKKGYSNPSVYYEHDDGSPKLSTWNFGFGREK